MPDLDVAYINRTPAYRWDGDKQWPDVGETVTFSGHVANRGGAAVGPFGYAWYVDGVLVAQDTHPGLEIDSEDILTHSWGWQSGAHTIKLMLDPEQIVSEGFELNNAVEDRTNALCLGIWVEQSFREFFNENVWQAGWGGNSFDDWIQRHVEIWNQMFAEATYPLMPQGVLDRVRLDKIVRVPDGDLNCSSNHPADDKTVDLIWGFISEMVGVPSPADCQQWTPAYRDNRSTWDRDMGIIHELNHARYLVDLYGFNVDSHEQHLATEVGATAQTISLDYVPDIPEFRPPCYLIIDGEIIYCTDISGNSFTDCVRGAQGTRARSHQAGATVYGDQIRIQDGQGNALVGSSGLPSVNGAFHRGPDFGIDIMNAGEHYGEHSGYAWNRIAGQRPVCGNYNAPCNIGEYLSDIPESNILEIRYPDGSSVSEALVEIYRAKPYPIWYGKSYEGIPDLVLLTDAQGRTDLGHLPFGDAGISHGYGLSNGVLALKIVDGNKVGVQFLDVTAFNLAYWRGNSAQAIHPVEFSHWTTLSLTPTPTRNFTLTPMPSPTPTETLTPTPMTTPTATTTPSPGSWVRQGSGTTRWIWPVQFTDEWCGWAGGEGGIVLGTTNGGSTWNQLSDGGPTVKDLCFVDDQYGWRVGWGYVARSTDGGVTWVEQDLGDSENLLAVNFVDRQHGWIVGGDSGLIRRTTDGGASWTSVAMPSPGTWLQNVYFCDSTRGWAVGWGGNILRSTDGGVTWQRQHSGTGAVLEAVYFVDSDEGWVVGSGGTVLHTTDGGSSWIPQSSGVDVGLMGVTFGDHQCGWAVGNQGTILGTSDGGVTWRSEVSGVDTILQEVFAIESGGAWAAGQQGVILYRAPDTPTPTTSPTPTKTLSSTPMATPTATTTPSPGSWVRQDSGTTRWLWSIRFTDQWRGWASGLNGIVLGTTNGGSPWNQLSDGGPTVNDLCFVDEQYGWRVGWGYVARSTDGGVTWVEQDLGDSENLLAVNFVDRQHGWIVGGDSGLIRRTTDGGASWTSVAMPSPVTWLQNVYFCDSTRGWAVGWGGNILRSTDGGVTWQRQHSGTGVILEAVYFVDSDEGWVVGSGGTILHTTDGGAIWVPQSSGVEVGLMDVTFVDRRCGWAVGNQGTILGTSDGGVTWRSEVSGVDTILQEVFAIESGGAWAAGQQGVILYRGPTEDSVSSLFVPLVLR